MKQTSNAFDSPIVAMVGVLLLALGLVNTSFILVMAGILLLGWYVFK